MNQNKINRTHSDTWNLVCLISSKVYGAVVQLRLIQNSSSYIRRAKEFKHSKKNRIDKNTRRWFFSRNAPSQWDVFRFDCWPFVELGSLSKLFETIIKQKTNPKVRIQNDIKPNATFCFVRFALRILLLH